MSNQITCLECSSILAGYQLRFCSRSCAAKFNNRQRTPESRLKQSISLKETIQNTEPSVILERVERWKVSIASNKEPKKARKERQWHELGYDKKRHRVIQEQNNCCSKCGINEWMGAPITLEIDHKNGIRSDNSRHNLEGLCPNCHSQTSTWRGRNKGNTARVSKEMLSEALLSTNNIRQALISVGLTPKGGNYKRAINLKQELEGREGFEPSWVLQPEV